MLFLPGFHLGAKLADLEAVYAFATRQDDHEMILCWYTPDGIPIPLVGAGMQRMETMRPMAEKIAEEAGFELLTLKFIREANES